MFKFKKILSLTLALGIIASMSTQAFAENKDDSALTFKEAEEKGIPYDKPLQEKSREELLSEGYKFYGGTVPLNPSGIIPFATTSRVLGYVTATHDIDVYSGKGIGTKLGIVSPREIVYISSIEGDYAYIQFKNKDQVLKYGYVDNDAIYSPAYGWSAPITSGRITQYYGDTATDKYGHTGVDVGGHNGGSPAVYATFSGEAQFLETVRINPDNSNDKYFAEYGNHIRIKSGNYEVIYAHLKSFGQGVPAHDYPSEGYPVSATISKYPITRGIKIATKRVNKGSTIGYVGTTGQSTGIHLHFEVRDGGKIKDPFNYIVFPNVSWASK